MHNPAVRFIVALATLVAGLTQPVIAQKPFTITASTSVYLPPADPQYGDFRHGQVYFTVRNATGQTQTLRTSGDCGLFVGYTDDGDLPCGDTGANYMSIAAGASQVITLGFWLPTFQSLTANVSVSVWAASDPSQVSQATTRVTWTWSPASLSAAPVSVTYTPSVSPKTVAVTDTAKRAMRRDIIVTNNGSAAATYALSAVCGGGATACSASVASLTVASGASAAETLQWSGGDVGVTGTARLVVTAPANPSGQTEADTATVTVSNVDFISPTLIITPAGTLDPATGRPAYVFTTPPTVAVDACDSDGAIGTPSVLLNGAWTAPTSSSATTVTGCNTAVHATFSIPFAYGRTTLQFRVSDGPHTVTATQDFNYDDATLYTAQIAVPRPQLSVPVARSVTDTFFVTNPGPQAVQYLVSAYCYYNSTNNNPACPSASIPQSTITVGSHATFAIPTTYVTPSAMGQQTSMWLGASYIGTFGNSQGGAVFTSTVAPVLPPQIVAITPSNGTTVTTSTVDLSVTWCDPDDAIAQRVVTWQGVTLPDTYVPQTRPGCASAGTSAWNGVSMDPWTQTLTATATDAQGHSATASSSMTRPIAIGSYRPSVTPKDGRHYVPRLGAAADTFAITNAGTVSATYALTKVCGVWTAIVTISNCSLNKTSVTLAPGASTTAIVSYTGAGETDLPDTLKLIATYTSPTGLAIADTGRRLPLSPAREVAAVVPSSSGSVPIVAPNTTLYQVTGMLITNNSSVPETYRYSLSHTGAFEQQPSEAIDSVITIMPNVTSTVWFNVRVPSTAGTTGSYTLTASFTDASGNVLTGSGTMSLVAGAGSDPAPAAPSVSPNDIQIPGGANRDSTMTFQIQNVGGSPGTFFYTFACDAAANCAAPAGQLQPNTDFSLGAGASQTVVVSYRVGAGPFSLVRIIATSRQNQTLAATGSRMIAVDNGSAISVRVRGLNADVALSRGDCLTIAAGDEAAYECADLRLVHALPTTTTLGRARTPTLIYSSAHAHPIIRIAADVSAIGAICPTSSSPITAIVHVVTRDTVQRRLAWTGTCGQNVTRRIVVPVDARRLSLTEGVYRYSLELLAPKADGSVASASDAGSFVVVDRGTSAFGAGWWLDGVERLLTVADSENQLLWIGGDGSTRVYTRTAGDPSTYVVSPVLDRPDTLVQLAGIGYRRHLPNGAYVEFDQNMRHAWTVNARGDSTRFVWSGGLLTEIRLPMPHASSAMRSYVFAYANGALTSVTAPAGPNGPRVTTIARAGADLSITDPGAPAVHYTLASDGAIIARANRLGDVTRFAFDAPSGVLVGSTLDMTRTGVAADSIHYGFCPAEASGLIACASVVVDSAHLATTFDGPREDRADMTTFWLTPFGAPARVTNAIGQTTTIERGDPRFPLLATKTIASNGFTTVATYNDRGLTETQTAIAPFGGLDAITRYFWNSPGALTLLDSVRAPTGEMSRFGYFANGDRRWQEDARGPISHVEFSYNGNRQLATIQQPGRSANDPPDALAYEPVAGNLQSSTTSGGARTTFHTDAIGRVDTVYSPIGTRAAPLVSVQADSFDLLDQVLVHRAIGPPSHYDIGAAGGTVSGTAPAETLTVTTVYDPEGRALSVKREANASLSASAAVILRSSYDAAGRTVTTTDDQNHDERIAYDKAGNVTTRTLRRGNVIRTTYDALNRPERVITDLVAYGADRRNVTDEPGNPQAIIDHPPPPAIFPYFAPGWAFDWMQPATSGYPNLVIAGDTSTLTYDVTGGVATATNSVARITRTYFVNGALKSDVSTLASLDTMGELVGRSFGVHRYALNYLYDLSGRRTSRTDTLPNCVSCAQVYSYANGFLDQTTDRNGRFRFNYHPAGWLSGWTAFDASNAVVAGESRDYDADGRMTTRTVRRGVATDVFNDALQYDDANRVTTADVTSTDNSMLADHVVNAYSGLGALAAMKRERNAVVTVDEYLTDAFGHQLTRGARNATTGPAVASDTMIYGGERLLKTSKAPRSWIAGMATPSNDMDTTSYDYDVAGNQTRSRTMVASFFGGSAQAWRRTLAGWSWTWNAYGGDEKLHVSQRTFWKDSATQRTAFVEYFYDALGRRVQTRTRWDQHCDQHAAGDCQSSITRTVWDGDQILTELRNDNLKHVVDTHPGCIDGSDVATNPACQDHFLPYDTQIGADLETEYSGGAFAGAIRYTHAGGIDQPIALWRSDMSAGVVPLANWRGLYEAGAYIGATNVGVAWPAWNQDAFFANDARIGNNAVQPTHWLGAMVDGQADAAGMRYMRNRYYDSKSGRFTQEDPIGLGGGMNQYGFGAGNPINTRDPFGLCVEDLCIVEIATAYRVARTLYTLYQAAQAYGRLTASLANTLEARRTVQNGGRFSAATQREAEIKARNASGGPLQCKDCGEDFDKDPKKKNRDHDDPWNGGRNPDNSVDNLAFRCGKCNNAKSNLTPAEWEAEKARLNIARPDATAVRPNP